MSSTAHRRLGRPPKHESAMFDAITVRFPKPMMAEIEEIMSERMDQPDKGQVIRELVVAGLAKRKREPAHG